MGWDGVGMGWDGMGWDGMGWDGMGWDGDSGKYVYWLRRGVMDIGKRIMAVVMHCCNVL